MPSVSQTSVIFFGLLIGFLVFITVRGELAAYLYVIGLGGSAAGASTPVTRGGGGITFPGQQKN